MELNRDNMNSKLEGVHKLPHQYLTRGKCLFNYYHHSNIIIISPLMIGLSLLILHNQLVLPKFWRCKQYTINTVVHIYAPQYTIATLFQAANRGERWWKSSTAKQRQNNRICDGLWLWLVALLGGGVKKWLTLQTRSKNILILSLNLGSLWDESQSCLLCSVFQSCSDFKVKLSTLKSQILNLGSQGSLLVSLKNYFSQP